MSRARIRWISGPVLRAAPEGLFRMRESIRVGPAGLLGEVIRVQEDEIVAQVYEDTTGLRPGVVVEGSGALLSVLLGPHLLGGIFDGLLRPLARPGAEVPRHVEPGAAAPIACRLTFTPTVTPGQRLEAAAAFGRLRVAGAPAAAGESTPATAGNAGAPSAQREGDARRARAAAGSNAAAPPAEQAASAGAAGPNTGERVGHRLDRAWIARLPPDCAGEVVSVAVAGDCDPETPLLVLRDAAGRLREVAAAHRWPVRTPRPVAARLPADEPLVTGQRVLDSLFPVALGGKGAIPGGFGTGKTILLEALAKGCHADVIVYLGCGERGNELAGVLEEFPQLEDPRSGRPLMERTVVIANTSNMPVAAREASIYAAVTVAEYFRDQGLHVALMADSTSRWAEALREVSGRFGELPGEGGYPNYLSSRIADFYERAAKVKTLAGDIGSVTLLGSISPPSGDFSEPVTSHTKRYVRSFWALDARRAQARFYPAVNPLQSYSEDALDCALWWAQVYGETTTARARAASGENEWLELRRRVLTLLDEQARLERMARIIGKDALPARQRLTLACAELVNEAFLRQSAFSPADRYCGPQRQAAMLRLLARFIERAERALDAGVTPETIAALPLLRRLTRMGEDIDERDATTMRQRFAALEEQLEAAFDALGSEGDSPPLAAGGATSRPSLGGAAAAGPSLGGPAGATPAATGGATAQPSLGGTAIKARSSSGGASGAPAAAADEATERPPPASGGDASSTPLPPKG
jgi:V/A-type H+-transporting ATPase subunit A